MFICLPNLGHARCPTARIGSKSSAGFKGGFNRFATRNATLTIGPPATFLEVERVEAEIERSFPAGLETLHLFEPKLIFRGRCPLDRSRYPEQLPEELAAVTFGRLDLDLKAFPIIG